AFRVHDVGGDRDRSEVRVRLDSAAVIAGGGDGAGADHLGVARMRRNVYAVAVIAERGHRSARDRGPARSDRVGRATLLLAGPRDDSERARIDSVAILAA